jgi:hypothetical protein
MIYGEKTRLKTLPVRNIYVKIKAGEVKGKVVPALH